jgi:hypothetical protein
VVILEYFYGCRIYVDWLISRAVIVIITPLRLVSHAQRSLFRGDIESAITLSPHSKIEGYAEMANTTETRKPKSLDQMRQVMRVKHYSYQTEKSYLNWARRYILSHGKRHPSELGTAEVRAFLSHLAVDRHVSASTYN